MKHKSNKIESFGKKRRKKRRIIIPALLAWSLIFGGPKLISSRSSSRNNKNQVVHQRVLSNQDFNSLNHPNSRIIWVKIGDSSPSVPTRIGRGQPSNFPSGIKGGRHTPYFNPNRIPPKIAVTGQGLGAPANPAGAGNGGGAAEFDDNSPAPKKEQSQESKIFDYDYRPNDPKKKKESDEQCSLYEQNKAGIDELPDSSKFIYNLEGKSPKQEIRRVWNNARAKKEVLAGLGKMNRGELVPRNQKSLQGFKNLKEIKLNKTRIFINPGKGGAPDQIVGIILRKNLEDFIPKLAQKFK